MAKRLGKPCPVSFDISFIAFLAPCAPFHSVAFRCTPLHSVPLRSTPFHSVPLCSTPLHSIALCSCPFHPFFQKYSLLVFFFCFFGPCTPFHSIAFRCTPFHSFALRSTPLHSVPFRFTPGTFAKHFCHTFSIFSDSCRALLPSTLAKHFCRASPSSVNLTLPWAKYTFVLWTYAFVGVYFCTLKVYFFCFESKKVYFHALPQCLLQGALTWKSIPQGQRKGGN